MSCDSWATLEQKTPASNTSDRQLQPPRMRISTSTRCQNRPPASLPSRLQTLALLRAQCYNRPILLPSDGRLCVGDRRGCAAS